MAFFNLDTDHILSRSQHWMELEQKWGTPVDLDAEDDSTGRPVSDSIDSDGTTFDSADLMMKLKRASDLALSLHVPQEISSNIGEMDLQKSELASLTVKCEFLSKNVSKIRVSVRVKRGTESSFEETDSSVEDGNVSGQSDSSVSLDGGYSGDDETSYLSELDNSTYANLVECIDRLYQALDSEKRTYL